MAGFGFSNIFSNPYTSSSLSSASAFSSSYGSFESNSPGPGSSGKYIKLEDVASDKTDCEKENTHHKDVGDEKKKNIKTSHNSSKEVDEDDCGLCGKSTELVAGSGSIEHVVTWLHPNGRFVHNSCKIFFDKMIGVDSFQKINEIAESIKTEQIGQLHQKFVNCLKEIGRIRRPILQWLKDTDSKTIQKVVKAAFERTGTFHEDDCGICRSPIFPGTTASNWFHSDGRRAHLSCKNSFVDKVGDHTEKFKEVDSKLKMGGEGLVHVEFIRLLKGRIGDKTLHDWIFSMPSATIKSAVKKALKELEQLSTQKKTD